MAAEILNQVSTVVCSHGAAATPDTTFPHVTVAGQKIVTMANSYSINTCSADPPCLKGFFWKAAVRVSAGGVPVVTMESESVCVPTGLPLKPQQAQTRVLAK
jgi:hypothetical protein